MSDEYVEVPVTRRARVLPEALGRLLMPHRWGAAVVESPDGRRLELEIGTVLVLRPPTDGAPLRNGIGRVAPWGVDVTQVPAAAEGDLVYRVEPE